MYDCHAIRMDGDLALPLCTPSFTLLVAQGRLLTYFPLWLQDAPSNMRLISHESVQEQGHVFRCHRRKWKAFGQHNGPSLLPPLLIILHDR